MAPSLSQQLGFTEADVVQYLRDDLNSNILVILCYGLYTSVYFYTVYAIGKPPHIYPCVPPHVSASGSSKEPMKRRAGHLIILTFMWALTTIRTALIWNWLNDTFIIHGATREDSFDVNFSLSPAIGIPSRITLAVNVAIAECVMVRLRSLQFPE